MQKTKRAAAELPVSFALTNRAISVVPEASRPVSAAVSSLLRLRLRRFWRRRSRRTCCLAVVAALAVVAVVAAVVVAPAAVAVVAVVVAAPAAVAVVAAVVAAPAAVAVVVVAAVATPVAGSAAQCSAVAAANRRPDRPAHLLRDVLRDAALAALAQSS